jgi:hypothetical protein
MCRSIKTLYHLEPPAGDEEIRDAALQFVRKVSGYRSPSRANEPAFEAAVRDVALAVTTLFDGLVTDAPPRVRLVREARAHARGARRRRLRRLSPPPGAG